jgi:carbon monoxide dehydrogenase subunit G
MPLQLTANLPAAPEQVWPYFTEMDRFVSVHPLIVSAKPLPDGRYRIRERSPYAPWLGGITRYTARIEPLESHRLVRMHGRVAGGLVKLELTFRLEPTATGTHLQETVQFRSGLPVAPLLRGVFRKAHTQLFQQLASVLQG